jgi:hypothetical protein
MLSTTPALLDIFKKNTSIKIVPKVVLENNMNYMAKNIVVTSTNKTGSVTDANLAALFPASSVIELFRPSKPGVKYSMQEASKDKLSSYTSKTTPTTRVYLVGKNSKYKYYAANQAGTININYGQNIQANKFVLKFEVNHTRPTVNIQAGTTVVFNGQVPESGIIEKWYNGSAWQDTDTSSVDVKQTFITLSVTATSPGYIGIIEISPLHVKDISSVVSELSIKKDDSSSTDLLPVGMITSNSLSMSLFEDKTYDVVPFTKGNAIDTTKIQIGINSKLKVSAVVDDTNTIQQGIFYAVSINEGEFGSFSVDALDVAKHLQEMKCPEILIENAPFQSIIWRLLDTAGFVDYDFTNCQNQILTVKYWWGDENRTVWQALQELCRETQTIAYVDEYGKLVFYDKTLFYSNAKTPSWTFRYAADGDNKPDIIGLSKKETPTSNNITVNYSVPMVSSLEKTSNPAWDEQSPSTLYAAPFQGIVTDSGVEYIKYSLQNVFSASIPTRMNSYVIIDQEVIEYEGIEFSYPSIKEEDAAGVIQTVAAGKKVITNDNDFLEMRSRYGNTLIETGRLKIKSRGMFGTTSAVHNSDPASFISPWSAKHIDPTSTPTYGPSGVQWPVVETDAKSLLSGKGSAGENLSALVINKNPSGKKNTYNVAYKAMVGSYSTYTQYGTKFGFKLDENISGQEAGMIIGWDPATKNGYRVKIVSTKTAASAGTNELTIQKIVGGVVRQFSKPLAVNVFENRYYPLEVVLEKQTGKNIITAYVGAGNKSTWEDAVSPLTVSNNIAVYSGSQSTSYFDYIYATSLKSANPDFSVNRNISAINLLYSFGGYDMTKFKQEDITKDIYEFGSVAREMYKYDIGYYIKPSIPQAVASTNPYVEAIGLRLGSFGGEFFLVNTSSSTVELAGDNGIKTVVIAKNINKSGPMTIEKKPASGEVSQSMKFDTSWIQTKASAESLATWLQTQWSKATIDVEMECFGNPLFQVGDVVTVNYPDRGFDGTGKYVIRSINQSFSTGLNTSLVLRSILV